MTEPIIRAIYASKVAPSLGAEALSAEVEKILETSRHNNARDGVTGALIFNARFFGQVLEGPADAVDATFERIQTDSRHHDVTLLSYDPVAERAFPDWSMGYVGPDSCAAFDFGTMATSLSADLTRMPGDALFARLHALALREGVA